MTIDEQQLEDATLFRRLAALVYDLFIVVAILFLGSAIGITIAVIVAGETAVTEENVLVENPVFFGWLLFCWCYYYYYCWIKTGQTLAMKTWRMKLITVSGEPLKLQQALIRFFLGFCGFSNLTAILPSRWTLHDSLSKTRIVVLPKGQ